MKIPMFEGPHTFDLKLIILRGKIDWPTEAYKIKVNLHEKYCGECLADV